MSTDKFNIHEMGTGNDTHSNFLRRMGYGDLLNRPGRQEVTLDTASMYKKAADASTMLTGTGAAAGGLAGNLLADYTDTGALGRLLMTVAGAGIGGVGGNILGKHLDTTTQDGMTLANRNRSAINAAALGTLGSLAGYGTSKFVLGSKNKAHNLVGALAGGGLGAFVGSHIAKRESDPVTDKEILDIADDLGLQGDQRENFIRDYTAALSEEKNMEGITDRLQWLVGTNPTEMDKVIARYKGEEIPTESWVSWWKTPILGNELLAGGKTVLAGAGKATKGKKTRNLFEYIADRGLSYTGRFSREPKHNVMYYHLPSILNNKVVKGGVSMFNSPKIKSVAVKSLLMALTKGRFRTRL